ncbi:glycosyltransferase family 9 protein [Gramella sp. AN32]|uniref:Glycosyltransferase family 9 protein n=1 Tax=Christiangramia antarctica TaxID=2058158 RepID=A0ABW5X7P5_9FLAO|nr:glycosyltransferase family 9 protein [Gramella sp. AN32]MCM4154557.1 glycosyltransferase [Gramella sp. AN32]
MKILIIQMKMIGDVLTSSILFEALREKYPEAELHYLVFEHTLPIVENNPFIDYVIVYKKDQRFSELAKNIRAQKYNVVIDVLSNLKTAMLTGISGAKIKVSYDKFYTRRVSTHVFSRNIQAKTIAGSAIEKRLRMLSPLSPDFPTEIKPKIYLTETEIEKAKATLTASEIDLNKTIYMIGALGSNHKKTYPLPYFAKLLDQIVGSTKAELLFNYMPSQRGEIEKLFDLCQPGTQQHIHLNIYGKNLREFLALTYHCDALIGNEGGGVNMAKALNVPSFAIFAPPLNKSNWNMYEDGNKNVSVHLKDYKPKLFEVKPEKQLKKEWEPFYQKFLPELIENDLHQFLKNNSK